MKNITQERFWSKVDIGDNHQCWEWQAGLTVDGYGFLTFPCAHTKSGFTTKRAHRLVFELQGIDIPDNMIVMHSCDNRKCVNPSHLKIATQQENIQDMFAKGRRIQPSRKGVLNPKSKLNEEDVRFIRSHCVMGKKGNVKQLAKKYNITDTTVKSIYKKQTWQHVH